MKLRKGQFDLTYIIYLVVALVLLLLIRLFTPPPPPPVNINGTWEGSWNLSSTVGPFSIMGPQSTFVMNLQEDSDGHLWGEISFPGNTMLATSDINGAVSGSNVNFTADVPIKTLSSTPGAVPVTITGDFSFSGYVSPSLRLINGSMSVNMTSAVGIGIFSISGPSLSVGGDWTASKK